VTAPPAVDVLIVSHDSAADLPGCLAAAAALEHRPLRVVVVDCASADGSPAAAEAARAGLAAAGVELAVEPLAENLGFAGGMNRALALADAAGRPAAGGRGGPLVEVRAGAPAAAGEWVLSLNPDARPAPDYLTRLRVRAAAHPGLRVGAVTGRLVREAPAAGGAPLLDACGMRLTRSWRHLDRGSGEPDDGRYGRAERVFGATGAASLFARRALADVAVGGEVFDPRFHSFREDAELAFRLRERGWEVLYEPAARAAHRRRVLPERRRRLPPAVNRHSLKNRYLLRLYHQTAGNFWRTLPWALGRDLAALAWVLAAERSSLPAYAWLWRHRREILARRRAIQARRTVPARELDRWFGRTGAPL
jgi:GT2 family glycosyltransferase